MNINNLDDAWLELQAVLKDELNLDSSYNTVLARRIIEVIRAYGKRQYNVGFRSGWQDRDSEPDYSE